MLITKHKGFTFTKQPKSDDILVFAGVSRIACLKGNYTDSAFKVAGEGLYIHLCSHVERLREERPGLTPGSHRANLAAQTIGAFDTTQEKESLLSVAPTTEKTRPSFRL